MPGPWVCEGRGGAPMIANQVKGRGFGGTVAYVLGKDGAERSAATC